MINLTALNRSLQEYGNKSLSAGELCKSEPFSYRILSDLAVQTVRLAKGLFLFLRPARTGIPTARVNRVDNKQSGLGTGPSQKRVMLILLIAARPVAHITEKWFRIIDCVVVTNRSNEEPCII